MPGIDWYSTCDNSEFVRSMNEMSAQIRQTKSVMEALGTDASTAISKMDSAGKNFMSTIREIGAIAGVSFSIAQAKSFVSKISEVRGYFQDIESSMKVFLGNEQKAQDFTNKLKDYAYYNMFEFSDLAQASKQMIAYGNSVDTIIPRLDQLSNVARGTNAPLMEMVGAYNRAKNLGGLGARDLQAWAAKGLVIKDILKDIGETTKGNTVTFEQLNKVLDHVTGEGGMFHNLMGEQMNNITAEQGQLEDTLASMYNELGERYQDTIVKWYKTNSEIADSFVENSGQILDVGAGVADFLLDHYQQIGNAILRLITLYGEWKAAMIATNAVRNARKEFIKDTEIKQLNAEIEKEKKGYEELLNLKAREKNADLAEAVAKGKLSESQARVIAAKRKEFENIQIEKELLGVEQQITEMKRLKLDADLQEKVATEALTLSQAEEVQQRRAVLAALEKEIALKKESVIAGYTSKIEDNEAGIRNAQKRKAQNLSDINRLDGDISGIDKQIEKLEKQSGMESEINELKAKRSSIIEQQAKYAEDNIIREERIRELNEENKTLAQQQANALIQYTTDNDEKLRLLNEQKAILKEQYAEAEKIAIQSKSEYEAKVGERTSAEERLRQLEEELQKRQQINKVRSEQGAATEDLSPLSDEIEEQRQLVEALSDASSMKEEDTLATKAQEAAEKAENIQEQINTVETQANTIATGVNTKAKSASATATNAQTVSERIHMATTKAATIVTTVFSTAVTQAKNAIKAMGTAIMTNPLGILIGALTMALPYLMQWVGGTDDASESVKDYSNEAKDAASKVDSLFDVIDRTEKGTKAHKDAVDDLKKTYEDYGIELKKTKDEQGNEIVSTDELRNKHDLLVKVLQQEAIERQKINDIKNADKEYEMGRENADKRMQKGLSDEFTDSQKTQLVNFISDDDIDKAASAWDKYQKAIVKFNKVQSPENLKARSEAYKEYKATLQSVSDKTVELSKSFTDSGKAQENASKWATWHTERLAELRYEQQKNAEDANNAAAATLRVAEAQDVNARRIRYARMSTSELRQELENLVQSYKDTRLHVTIDFNQVNVPGWMKGMDLDKLKQQQSYWTAQLADMQSKGVGARYFGKKKMTVQEVATHAAQYNVATTQKEDAAAAAAARNQNLDEDKRKAEQAANAAANRRRKLAELDRKEREERKKQAAETADSVAQARIAAEQDAAEKERLEIEYQYDRDMETIKRLEDDYRKRTLDAKKARWEAENTNKALHYEDTDEYKSYIEDMSRIALTEDQLNDIKARTVIAEERKKDALRKSYESELDAYKNYVSEYGSLAQQQYAISKQYDEKRRTAKNEWERRALDRNEERDLSAARLQEMTLGIDWKGLMSGVGTLAKDMMQPTLEALREYTKSEEYRNADADTQEKVASLIQELREYVGSDQEVTWQTLGKAMEDFQGAVEVYRKATEENKALKYDLEMAEKAVARGKKDLADGVISQEDYDKLVKNAQDAREAFDEQSDATSKAKETMDGYGKVLNNVSEEVENHVSNLRSVLNNAESWKGVEGFGGIVGSVESIDQFKGTLDKVLPTMTEGLGKDIGMGLSSILGKNGTIAAGLEKVLSSGIGQMVGFIIQIPKLILQLADTIKNFVTGIIDSFSELLKFEWLEDLVNSILEAVGNLINVIFDLPENIFHVLQSILVNGVGSLINTIVGRVGNILSLGLIDSKDPFGWADNTAKMQKKIDELTNHSDALARAMSSLEEAFEKAYGVDAMNRAEDMQKLQEQRMRDYQQTMIAEANKHGFMASSLHSSVEDNRGWKDAMKQVSNLLGISIKSSKDFLQLSAEQMQKIIDYDNGELWYKILQEYRGEGGKNGRSDQLASMLGNYVDEFGKAFEEIANDLSEKLTLTTEDNVLSDFQNSLYELADGSEEVMDDIATNWQQMVNRMVISNLVMRDFQEDLKKWYEDLAKLQEQRNTGISDEEYERGLDALKDRYNALVGNAQKSIENFREMGIIKSIEDVEKEAKVYFEDLASSWASTLTDMTSTAEDWKQQLLSRVFSDLVESTILEAPLDTMIDGAQKHFDSFNAYLEDWTQRYKEVIENTTLTDEERNARLKALIDEQTKLRDSQAEKVRALGEGIGYEVKEEISNSLDNIGDTILDNLLGTEEDAEAMGRQVASTMIREMLETMLASEKYKAQFDAVRKKWQSILSGENVDEQGTILFTLDDVLSDIADINNSIANDTDLSKLIAQYKELNKTVEDTAFKDLRSTFFDALTNINDDAESFRKRLEQTMAKDLIEKNVLDIPLTVNGQTFNDFTAYVEDWNKRYASAVKDGNQEAIDALLTELVNVREMTVNAAEGLRERLKESVDDTTFKGMNDNFISSLMDMNSDADDLAQDIGKTIARRIIDQMVSASMIQPLLDNLQSAVDNALAAEGATWKTAMNDSGVRAALQAITDSYPELQGVAREITKALGVIGEVPEAFSDLRGTFVSTLLDMEADAETLGKKIAETMMEQMLETLVDSKYASQMEEINKEWASALENGDSSAIDGIRTKLLALYNTIGEDEQIKMLVNDIKALNKTAADTPLSGLRSSFLSDLMNLESTTEDFADNINKILTEAFVDKFVLGEGFDEMLEKWQERYREIMDSDISESDRAAQLLDLKRVIGDARDNYTEQARAIQELMGITDTSALADQEAHVNMADKATYDQFELYLGIATAQQIALEQGNDVRKQILSTLQMMGGIASPNGNTVMEIRSMLRTTNEHLYAVKIATEGIRAEFLPRLQSIDNKLSKL